MTIHERRGERTLRIAGSLAPAVWLLAAVVFPFFGPLLAVAFVFFPVGWVLGPLVAVSALVVAVVRIPIQITVTADGLFDARRPWLPGGEFGHVPELSIEVYRSGAEDHRQVCIVEARGRRLWRVRELAPSDTAVIDAFVAAMHADPELPSADLGAYRSAA